MLSTWIRVKAFRGRIFPIVALICFVAYSLSQAPLVTATGVQCPTAPVQQILSFAKGCCGTSIRSSRVPRPGDKSFRQCRCAERKSSQVKASGSQKPTFVEGRTVDILCLAPRLDKQTISTLCPQDLSIQPSPRVRPPAVA